MRPRSSSLPSLSSSGRLSAHVDNGPERPPKSSLLSVLEPRDSLPRSTRHLPRAMRAPHMHRNSTRAGCGNRLLPRPWVGFSLALRKGIKGRLGVEGCPYFEFLDPNPTLAPGALPCSPGLHPNRGPALWPAADTVRSEPTLRPTPFNRKGRHGGLSDQRACQLVVEEGPLTSGSAMT